MQKMDVKQLNEELCKDLPTVMNKLFGEGQWSFDESDQLYIARDPKYNGPGFGFIAIGTDGSFFTGIRPDDALQ